MLETSEVSKKFGNLGGLFVVPAPRVGINPHAISHKSLQDWVWLGVLLWAISCNGFMGAREYASCRDAR